MNKGFWNAAQACGIIVFGLVFLVARVSAESVTAKPGFRPPPGTYTSTRTLTLIDKTPGAVIYFTTDGSPPSTGSLMYTAPIAISETTTVQAIAVAVGDTQSAMSSGTYTITRPTDKPSLSPVPGTYTTEKRISLSDKTPGAVIYFTTDGSTPTTSSPAYTAPIAITETTTVQAIAVAVGDTQSAMRSGTYTITRPTDTPGLSPIPGTYTTDKRISLSDKTPGAVIYYTTDGSPPTTGSPMYTAPILISKTTTVSAIAVASGYSQSEANSGTYTMIGPLTISPRNAALTLSQTQQFTTNAPLGTSLSWSVDGMAGGNASVGTVSSAGLYTPPASAGTHTLSVALSKSTASAAVAVTDLSGITLYHNDLARTGQNLQEYALTPASVSSGNFGKRWSCPLDGVVYAQPLYVANLAIGGGVHNVVIVATMHDSVYAFDADNPKCLTYWQISFLNPPAITSTSAAGAPCNDVTPEFGVTGTPAIDPAAQTLYLVTNTTEYGTVIQRLHALNLVTGSERTNSPVVIEATVPGSGDGGSSVSFNASQQNQRLGLTLTGGGVLIGWSSHCDVPIWHGWLMRYDASSLAQIAVFNTTPNGSEGGIWMSGGAPALDASGNMFLSTGNGTFDDTNDVLPAVAPNDDFGESFLNLNPTTLAVQDFFTPSQYAMWSSNDWDISSSGVTVLPDGVGPSGHPDILAGSDKLGHLWIIDRNRMSGFVPGADNTVQYLLLPYSANCETLDDQCVYGTPGYWNGTLYLPIEWGPLMAFQLSNGLVPSSAQAAIAASQSNESYGYPTPTPTISASPSSGAIVWVLDNNGNGTDNGSGPLSPAILRAYDATDLTTTLYSSSTVPADACGIASKFTLPVVANGHVYVAGNGALSVYALAP